jgi:hypothetical protein
MTSRHSMISNAMVKYYEWTVLLSFVTVLPCVCYKTLQKGLILRIGGLIVERYISTDHVSESAVCQCNGTVHIAHL